MTKNHLKVKFRKVSKDGSYIEFEYLRKFDSNTPKSSIFKEFTKFFKYFKLLRTFVEKLICCPALIFKL